MWSTNSDSVVPNCTLSFRIYQKWQPFFFNCNFFFVVSFYFLLNGKLPVDNISKYTNQTHTIAAVECTLTNWKWSLCHIHYGTNVAAFVWASELSFIPHSIFGGTFLSAQILRCISHSFQCERTYTLKILVFSTEECNSGQNTTVLEWNWLFNERPICKLPTDHPFPSHPHNV